MDSPLAHPLPRPPCSEASPQGPWTKEQRMCATSGNPLPSSCPLSHHRGHLAVNGAGLGCPIKRKAVSAAPGPPMGEPQEPSDCVCQLSSSEERRLAGFRLDVEVTPRSNQNFPLHACRAHNFAISKAAVQGHERTASAHSFCTALGCVPPLPAQNDPARTPVSSAAVCSTCVYIRSSFKAGSGKQMLHWPNLL